MRAILSIRKSDPYGQGHYGASRGARTHNGVDYTCMPGTAILPFYPGEVTKIGYPYADDLSFRYVQVTDARGIHARYFYVEPSVKLGDIVVMHTVIGHSQTLQEKFPPQSDGPMLDHVHFEALSSLEPKVYINPEEYI